MISITISRLIIIMKVESYVDMLKVMKAKSYVDRIGL
jgi:hypothetical protein